MLFLMKKSYIFILGQNPTLSLAETHAKFPQADLTDASRLAALFNFNSIEPLTPESVNYFGGTVKITELIEFIDIKKDNKLFPKLSDYINKITSLKKFGLSLYGFSKFDLKQLGIKLKNKHKNRPRFVFNRLSVMSSESVHKNKLLSPDSCEIIICQLKNQLVLANTISCQNPRLYAKRDDCRPKRDYKLGMIPPRLAQILLNLATIKPGDAVLDPFCGLGTILQEGALMGFKMLGLDNNQPTLIKTKQNLNYLKDLLIKNLLPFPIPPSWPKIDLADAKALSGLKTKFNAVVSEGYLGPNKPKEVQLGPIFENLKKTYWLALNNFKDILPIGARVVMTWPAIFS